LPLPVVAKVYHWPVWGSCVMEGSGKSLFPRVSWGAAAASLREDRERAMLVVMEIGEENIVDCGSLVLIMYKYLMQVCQPGEKEVEDISRGNRKQEIALFSLLL